MRHDTKNTKKDDGQRLHDIYVKHANDVDGQFHNMLWQIMINKSCVGTFIHVLTDDTIGVAQADGGFIPTGCRITNSDKRQLILDDLNREVFDLNAMQVIRIEAASFRNAS